MYLNKESIKKHMNAEKLSPLIVQVDGSFLCEACGWPMCGKSCSKDPVHSKQVLYLLKKFLKH
jgi:hypothetical protein